MCARSVKRVSREYTCSSCSRREATCPTMLTAFSLLGRHSGVKEIDIVFTQAAEIRMCFVGIETAIPSQAAKLKSFCGSRPPPSQDAPSVQQDILMGTFDGTEGVRNCGSLADTARLGQLCRSGKKQTKKTSPALLGVSSHF
ncbi:hypothetical protein NDU88_006593 [Pleurodeles waltl]|uniref:Uncharacterized protein n=1 Tax=Pleurodeles waltl TaxID=8319 RepID=A0AAV7UN78_PLEWA|nr:hypothetical protein NDU88_006593 [Pleurodeles waltl]